MNPISTSSLCNSSCRLIAICGCGDPCLRQLARCKPAIPTPVATPEFRKLLADEGKMLWTLIKARNIVVE